MVAVRVKMGTNGRLVVPARIREEMGLTDCKAVVLETVKGELRVRPMEVVVRHAQDRLRRFFDGKKSLSEDLIADRRAGARHE